MSNSQEKARVNFIQKKSILFLYPPAAVKPYVHIGDSGEHLPPQTDTHSVSEKAQQEAVALWCFKQTSTPELLC